MGLVLSSQDVACFTGLQEALLSPLQYESVDAWCAAVLRQADALFGADRSAMFVPVGDQIHYVSESIDPRPLDAFRRGLSESQPGPSASQRTWWTRRGRPGVLRALTSGAFRYWSASWVAPWNRSRCTTRP
jgi:hypothetical protein